MCMCQCVAYERMFGRVKCIYKCACTRTHTHAHASAGVTMKGRTFPKNHFRYMMVGKDDHSGCSALALGSLSAPVCFHLPRCLFLCWGEGSFVLRFFLCLSPFRSPSQLLSSLPFPLWSLLCHKKSFLQPRVCLIFLCARRGASSK